MKTRAAYRFFQLALEFVAARHPFDLVWSRSIKPPDTFRLMPLRVFLTEYCWVVYAAGFKVAILTKRFPALREAFAEFDMDKIVLFHSLDAALKIINNPTKAKGFVRGAKLIFSQGWLPFQARVLNEGPPALRQLPFIGPVTVKHLARNVGLADTAKDDIWLTRLAAHFDASSVDELVRYIAQTFRESQFTVDLVLWRFCSDAGWMSAGRESLEAMVASLD